MEQLPNKWCIRAENNHEAILIADYADPLNRIYNGFRWSTSDSKKYVLLIENGKYKGGGKSIFKAINDGYTQISFEDFENLAFRQPKSEPTYEIY